MEGSEAKEDKAVPAADIDKLFHISRFPSLPWSLLLLLYLPFGLVLTLLRVFISLQAMLLLALFPAGPVKRFLLRVFFGVLGIIVVRDSFHRKGSQTRVYISNRVSCIDHIVFHLALECITVSWGGEAPLLHLLLPHRTLISHTPDELEKEAQKMPEFDESRSEEGFAQFVVQPEPLPTTGSHALFQFSDWPCSLASNVQPIALTAGRPFGITLTTLHSSKRWDLLWILFVPATIFRVKLLAPMERREEEEVCELSERVQETLREELKMKKSEITMDDITTWLEESRKKAAQVSSSPATITQSPRDPSPQSPRETPGEPEWLQRMVEQVSTVMPQVPNSAIKEDLLRTQSVDATISNFLEGLVAYEPLFPPSSQPDPPKPSPAPSFNPSATSSAPSFKSSDLRPRKFYNPVMEAMHRQLSLDERKGELIENARKKYIEKHGLSVSG